MMLSPHFAASELGVSRASSHDVDRYRVLCLHTLEVLRLALGGTGITVISGHRPASTNTGRASSHHLPPHERVSATEQLPIGARMTTTDRGVWSAILLADSAAADVRHGVHRPELVYAVAEVLATRRLVPVGGLFWYPLLPSGRGGFVHLDNRGRRARETDKIPPSDATTTRAAIALVDAASAGIASYRAAV